ncbi:hypothetical protein [Methylosinus sp. KRF6]|uniref:hypothetical protein n=1 Tax=Methylosinus sp. KRF6 TaxID=2846853 RepID=UPI001C0E2547|nr:hypothetical protein [Methylosinus sp. KRF6]MBU3888585.1 hypothetical protein [Methylosinus sp. KRF6]
MNEQPQSPAIPPAQEILTRTRNIDEKTGELLALLDLLEEKEGESPLEAIRETLIQILVEQKDAAMRLTKIERAIAGR